MFKGLGQLASLMKQAQQMSGRMQEINDQLKRMRITGSAGGGMAEVDADGTGEVLAVRIDPGLVESKDREMIQDLLVAAFNQVQTKAKQQQMQAFGGMVQGADPDLLKDLLGPAGDA